MDTMISIMYCVLVCIVLFGGVIYGINRDIKIKRYTDQLGIGCYVSQIVPQLNPFDKGPIVYEVIDKKWNTMGECWVKLHIPNESSVLDKTMSVKDLYNKGYKITFPPKK